LPARLPIRSYQTAFILLFLILLAITVAGVSSNAYRRAAQASLDLSVEILAQVSQRIVDRAVEVFSAGDDYLVMNNLALGQNGIIDDRDVLFRLFWTQLQLTPRLQSLFAVDANGSLIQVRRQPQIVSRWLDRSADRAREGLIYRNHRFEPIAHIAGGATFDPRQRDWYQGAVANAGDLYWSQVYRFDTDGMPGITAARAVLDAKGRTSVVLGADVTLASLSELLTDQRLMHGAVPLIVDGRERLVAYPYAQNLRPGSASTQLPRVSDLAADWLVDAYSRYRDGSARVTGSGALTYIRTLTNGASYITYRQPFPGHLDSDWELFIVVPETSLLTSANRLLSESAVISLILLGVAGLAVWVLARRLFVPLAQLEHNTRRIRAFEFDEVVPVHSGFREIRSLDAAIRGLQHGLRTLEKYVPGDVARQLIASEQGAHPEVEVRDLTFFFTGIGQLAAVCQALPPERIAAVLSDELDRFTRVILRQRGTIDNYLGESIMAFWGAPIPLDDGPQRACLAALNCLQLESEVHAHWDEPDLPPPANLYAVHRGQALVGNIGSAQRMSYTALGDHVTLGSELRRLNHRYGTRIIVSGTAQKAVAERFWFRRLDVLPPQDASGPLALYELIGDRSRPLDVARASFIERYERGLKALLGEHWDLAEQLFEQLAAEYPLDPSVALMLGRCASRQRGYCQLMDRLNATACTAAGLTTASGDCASAPSDQGSDQ
jgi:adenylate cyclase